MQTTGSLNNCYFIDMAGSVARQPSYDEVVSLLKDTLENLRLMRQLAMLDATTKSRVLTEGYDLFDRWQELRGLPKFFSELSDE